MLRQDATGTRPYGRLVLDSIEEAEDMRNLCIAQGIAFTFFRDGLFTGVTVYFLLR